MQEAVNKMKARWPRLMLWMMAALMLWQVPKMIDLAPLTKATVPMAALWAAAGLGGVILFRLWREPGTALLLLGLCWMGGTSLLRGTLWPDLYTYVPCACAFLFCYHAPRIGALKDLRRQTLVVCTVWILWMTVLCSLALAAAIGGVHLRQTADVRFIGINAGDLRLYIMDYCTNAGGNILTAVLAAAGMILCVRKKPVRIAAAVCLTILLAALSLTDARTSFIGVGTGAGAIAACAVFHALTDLRKVKRYAAALACAAAVLVLVYLGISALTNLVGSLVPGSGASLLPTASADDGTVVHRTLGSGAGLLTYRDDVWRGELALLRQQPSLLLSGTGPAGLMERVNPLVVSEQPSFDHPHCIWLQLLGAYGVPGLLIALVFTALLIRDAWHMLFMGERPLWTRLLPVPAIAILVCETAECLTLGRVNGAILILLFFSAGATAAARQLTESRHPRDAG